MICLVKEKSSPARLIDELSVAKNYADEPVPLLG
jgi:hypothetical protein